MRSPRKPENNSVWIIIPSYNEAGMISAVIKELLPHSYSIVVVDDGSTDSTKHLLKDFPISYIKHAINLGQGAALQTGFDYALKNNPQVVVTFDADGQMSPHDIPGLVEPILNKQCDVSLGTRFHPNSRCNIPLGRKLLLKIAILYTQITLGLKLTDTHNGFRAFSPAALSKIRIRFNRMAHASDLLKQIKLSKLLIKEVPVNLKYTDYSIRKGQKSFQFFNIIWDLIFHQ